MKPIAVASIPRSLLRCPPLRHPPLRHPPLRRAPLRRAPLRLPPLGRPLLRRISILQVCANQRQSVQMNALTRLIIYVCIDCDFYDVVAALANAFFLLIIGLFCWKVVCYHWFTHLIRLECNEYEFRCNDGTCIDSRRKCDKRLDCPDSSDEDNCGKFKFWSNLFFSNSVSLVNYQLALL